MAFWFAYHFKYIATDGKVYRKIEVFSVSMMNRFKILWWQSVFFRLTGKFFRNWNEKLKCLIKDIRLDKSLYGYIKSHYAVVRVNEKKKKLKKWLWVLQHARSPTLTTYYKFKFQLNSIIPIKLQLISLYSYSFHSPSTSFRCDFLIAPHTFCYFNILTWQIHTTPKFSRR